MSGQMDTEATASEADLSQHNEHDDADDGSSTDLSLIQHTGTVGSGKGRLDSLRENLSKQQERLMALRERALRKTEDGARYKSSMSDSMESLKSLGQKLSILKGRSAPDSPHIHELGPQDMSTPLVTPTKDTRDAPTIQLEISGSEKLQMLNQRTEQNRALLEQRKRDMAKSLQSVKSGLRQSASSDLGSSMNDLRAMAQAAPVSRHRSAADLQQQMQQQQQQQQLLQQQQQPTDEGRLKLLKNKMKLIELKQTRKEQELQQELLDMRNELTQRNEQIQQLESTLSQQSEQLISLRPLADQEHTRLHTEIAQLRERNAELENSSEMLETTRLELHNAREQLLEQQSNSSAASTDAQVNQELAKQLQELENQLQQLRQQKAEEQQITSESERLTELEATIETKCSQLAAQAEQLAEKTTELNVLNVNLRVLEEKLAQSVKSKPIFLDEDSNANEQLQADLQQLKQKLDESNKSNIKLKLKCKQAEKQLQKLQSIDTQQELARLNAENEQLQQRIIVLEDEKGQWQLAHVEEDEEEEEAELTKLQAAATTQNQSAGQTEAIRLLEEQKEELQQALEALQQGTESARVESELSEVQLEEQLSQRVQQLETEANEQREQLHTLQVEKEALDKKLTHYINENMELLDKLEKLSSSSSAESIEIVERPTERRFSQRPSSEGDGDGVARADSVEHHAALPSFVSELTQTDLASPELEVNESLAQLRTESDELLKKIELFTNERREVLAKMEQLQAENVSLKEQLEQTELKYSEEQAELKNFHDQAELKLSAEQAEVMTLQAENSRLKEQLQQQSHLDQAELKLAEEPKLREQLKLVQEQLQSETSALQAQLEELQRDKQQLSLQLSEKSNLSQELSSMQRSSEVVAALDCGEGGAALFDKCERSLSRLSSELEAYRKADRNAKLNVSKKLAKEAKNVHIQLTELLHKVKEASTAVETVTVVETVVAVTAPNGKALAEYEQLTAQNAELKSALAALQAELAELRDSYDPAEQPKLAIAQQEEEQAEQQLQALRQQLQGTITELRAAEAEHLELIASQSAELVQLQLQAEQYDHKLNASEMAHEKHMEQQQRLRRELQSKIETLEGEMGILQALVAEQKQQLIESYSESEHESNLKLLELQQCQQELETCESRNKELREKLKKYALNLKKRTTDQAELEQQLQRLQAQLKDSQSHTELEQQLQAEQAAVKQLKAELQKLEEFNRQKTEQEQESTSRLKQLEQLNGEQQEQQHRLNEQLHQLQEQLQASHEDNQELKQQMVKHKSRLATLPKLKEEVERLQVELQNTVHANTSLRQESYQLEQKLTARDHDADNIDELRRQLEQKSIKFDKSKEVIKHRNATIQSLQRELAELRAQLQAQPEEEAVNAQQQEELLAKLQTLQSQNAQLNEEKVNFELAIGRLETLHEGIQAKLLQDQSYIESLETQNTEMQAKSAALEDQNASLKAQHSTATERVQLLEQQLQATIAQQTEHESQLHERLQQLTEHEQSHSRQQQLLSREADETREQLAALQANHEALLARHKQQTQQAQAEREQLSNSSEQELHELREQLQLRNQELQRQRNVYDAKLAAKATELDEMECDLSAHMERATAETRDLTQQLERTQEQLQARGEELTRLNEELADVERERATLSREAMLLRLQHDSAEQDVLELQELRMQALQDKTEMDNLRAQIDSLCANHNQELQALQQEIAELDTLGQNQTDDQVYIETENKRLAEQLTEMQARLDEQAEQLARQQAASQAPVPLFPAQYQAQAQAPAQSNEDWVYQWMRPNSSNPTQRQAVPVPAEQNVTIPAPAMFFSNDAAAVPSPFDEIVAQPLRMSTQGLGVVEDPSIVEPTIEDLQRNVSDLEKHAKELETKLLARNQALAEHEERRAQLERLLHEREQELARLQAAAEERERLAAIEKLIQAEPTAPVVTQTTAPTLDMFFGTETVTDAATLELGMTQSEPVVEEIITPKKAYICYPEQEQLQQPTQVIDWGVDEDPWASAAVAEQQKERPGAEAALQARIAELEQQKAELQTKTAKLMKRVKEYRSKEQQEQSKSVNNDLDGAIIDELKHQLQLHESRQAKTEELLQQHALEKEKLAKRIDVLTAGNERMAELKERQDMDVQMYQARIRELQEKLQQLESWGDEGAGTATLPSTAAASITLPASSPATAPSDAEALAKIENLQAENQDLNMECQELQAQLQEEKQHALDALAQAQREREQLQADKQRALEALGQQAEQERRELHEQLQADQQRVQAAQQEREQLQLQLEELKAKLMELPATVSAPSDESMALLQEKESEIVHLKQRIEELMREDQTEKLVLEILTKNQELQLLRMQIKQLEEDKLEKPVAAPEQPVASQNDNKLQQEMEQVRQQCVQLQQEKTDMEEELRVLNNHVLSSLELEDKMKQSVLELDMKTIEITELRKSLELLQQAQSQSAPQPQPQVQQPDLSALNQQWEALVEQKCSEVASIWQEHLAQREAAYQAQIDQLTTKQEAMTTETTTAQTEEQQERVVVTEDVNGMLLKMQKALETQEMEIVTLKEQLAIRSAEYARLASQYDPFRLQNTLGGGGGAVGATGVGATGNLSQEPLPEYVLKADLDYALMMLHQRDMRVEEMILELVQLLEERDHLQLKLSDTLRQLEAERTGVPAAAQQQATASATSTTLIASGSPIIGISSDPSDTSSSDLKQKLAELQTVKHSKDKAIVDEREQRLRQMIQLQRDMAKPATTATTATTTAPAAIAISTAIAPPPLQQQQQQQQLEVDPSQSSLRSPSMVLMDWILGNNKSEDEVHPSAASSN